MALMDPGDEVIILEPFYENYGPDAILAGASPVFVPLERPNWTLDADRLRKAFTRAPRRSSSTRRTIRPVACSRATRCR